MAIDFTQEYPFNAFKTVIIDGEVMVKVPRFYVRVYVPRMGKYAGMKCWEVSEDKVNDEYHLHPAFMRNGKELECFYIGAYTAYKKVGDIAGSKADEEAWTNVGGLERARQYCRNRGEDEGWHLQTVYERSALQILALLEMGHGDSQTKFGAGNVNTSAAVKTGASNATFHGIYELWGNYWEIVDGIKGDGAGNISIWDNKGNQSYINTGLKPATNNYIVDVYNIAGENYNLADTFIPSMVARESSSAFNDISEGDVNDNFTLLLNADYKSGVTQPGIFAVKWDKSVNDSNEDIAFRLAKYDVGLPYNVSAQFVYDGTSKSPELSNFNSELFILGGQLSAVDAGTYTITITPRDDNYLWKDGSSGTKTITWTISRQVISTAPSQKSNLIYNGLTQEPEWNNYDADKLTISGDVNGTNVGTYSVSFTPNSNYMWSNNSIGSVQITWEISRQTIENVPYQNGTLTYNSNEQSPVWNNYDAEKLTITGSTKEVNAGDYDITFTPTSNYCWSGGGTEAKTVTWHILRQTILTGVPTQKGVAIYTGNNQEPEWDNYDSIKLLIGGTTSSAEAGTFNVTFTPTSNYCWENNSITSKSATWTMIRAEIPDLPSQKDVLYYTGNNQSPSWNDYDSSKLTLSGVTSGNAAGSYEAVFTPKGNYFWTDGSTTPRTVTWTIQRQRITNVPTQKNTLTYNGSSQSATWNNYSSAQLTLSGNSATAAGTHEATFTPTSNYCWSDGTYAAKKINWVIGILKLEKPTTSSATEYTYDKTEKSITVTNFNSSRMKQTGTLKATNVGSYSVVYELIDKSNTSWTDSTTANVTISWSIKKQNVAIPSVTNVSKTYNTNAQSPTISTYDSNIITVTGNIGTNAGDYVVTMSLKDTNNYQWSDGSTTNKTSNWSIAKAKITTIPTQNGTLTYSGSEQQPSWSNYDSSQLIISGTVKGTNAGTYTATFTPTANYEWADVVLLSMTPTQINKPTYDGTEKTAEFKGYNSAEGRLSVGGVTTATEAGNYEATFTPTKGNGWA